MPVILFFLFVMIILPVVIFTAKQKEAQRRAAANRSYQEGSIPTEVPVSRPAPVRTAPASPYAASYERKSAEKPVASPYVKAAAAERRPLEKTVMKKTMPEKPIADRDDCEGGSIHDGYHEGVSQLDMNRPAAVAGNLGRRLADEEETRAREKASAENAKRVMERIGKLPPLTQGIVYSEILGKPKSEIA